MKSPSLTKTWPTPQDYNEAVQNLALNLSDAELKSGEIDTGTLGIPRPITGAFASVYKVSCNGTDWALRCFLRDIPDTQMRYQQISDFVQSDSLVCTVPCDFEPQGIRIGGNWFPVLKMEWVNGPTLDNYLFERLNQRQELVTVCNQFLEMSEDLRKAGIAHGDLQHGNIIVREEQLYLVDYDGMYVPSMHGSLSNELGHRNYQHPRRTGKHFGPYLDHFSQWVIFTSLYAVATEPALYHRLGAGEECLLFRQSDFLNPLQSCAFAALEQHSDSGVRKLGTSLRYLLQLPLEEMPALDQMDSFEAPELQPLDADTPTYRPHPSPVAAAMPASADGPMPATVGAYNSNHYSAPTHVEPELMQSVPRMVQFNSSSGKLDPWMYQAFMVVPIAYILASVFLHSLSSILFLLALLIIPIEIWIWTIPLLQWQLVSNGQAALGRITGKEFKEADPFEGDSRGHRVELSYAELHRGDFYILYQFTGKDSGGRSHSVTGKMKVDQDTSESLQKGMLVTILYNPADLSDSLIYKFGLYKARL